MSAGGPLRILLISPDPKLREDLIGGFAEFGREVILSHAATQYPSGTELARSLRTFSPQVVFLSFEDAGVAIAVMRFLESEADGLPVIGLHRACNPNLLREAMRAGVRDFLSPPFDTVRVGETLQLARTLLRRAPLAYAATDHIYSFLPSKPGVGTSTVALNTSAALAREPGTKVLLTDLDLTCGMLRFLLKLPQDLSIVDALARAAEMDVSIWPQLVTHRDGLDVLHSGSINPQAYLDPEHVQGLIDFARSAYNALFFDLSGNMERHSIQVMQESKRVFLVCNPEPGSLFLGRERLLFLNSAGVGDRVSVIVNRSDQAMAVSKDRIERFLGVPVAAAFCNNPAEVNRSIGEGCSVVGSSRGKRSRLAQEYREFATALLASPRVDAQPAVSTDVAQATPAVA